MQNIFYRINQLVFLSEAHGQNVGIGTATPSQRLHVYASISNARVLVQGDGAASTNGLMLQTTTGQTTVFRYGPSANSTLAGVSANDLSVMYSSSGALLLGSGSLSPIHFLTNGQERMRIAETGFVGVGITNPDARLHLRGNMFIQDDPSFSGIYFKTSSNGNKGRLETYSDGLGLRADRLYIGPAANALAGIYINEQGHVGIGTNTQNMPLGVFADQPEAAYFASNNFAANKAVLTARLGNPLPVFGLSIPVALQGLAAGGQVGVRGSSNGNGVGVRGETETGVAGDFWISDWSNGAAAIRAVTTHPSSYAAILASQTLGGSHAAGRVWFRNTAPTVVDSGFPFAFEVAGTGANFITIANTGHANHATDLLFVTRKWVSASVAPIHVRWTGTNWIIATDNGSNIPAGETFNVMVVKR